MGVLRRIARLLGLAGTPRPKEGTLRVEDLTTRARRIYDSLRAP